MPLPLVGIVLGRDIALFAGAFAIRAHSLKWKWPGAREFFRIVPVSETKEESGTGKSENGLTRTIEEGSVAPVAPPVQPLFISKVNTVFQLGLVGACMTDAWLGWPGGEIVWGLGMATAGTTVGSCIAYGRAYMRGELSITGR